MSAPISGLHRKLSATYFRILKHQLPFQLLHRLYGTVAAERKLDNISTILNLDLCDEEKQPCCVQGWIKSVRKHKDVSFLHINDGSCLKSLQGVIDSTKLSDLLEVGCSVEVSGSLVRSQSARQPVEMVVDSVNVLGQCSAQDYPFKVKTRHSADYVRQYIHLRPRTNSFSALLRIRDAATFAVHDFFRENGYLHVHTPVITANDCEGAGEVFTIQANVNKEDKGESSQKDRDVDGEDNAHFFHIPAFLTVSGQLHLEVVNGAFKKVYTFGPTFRADPSLGRHHLSEFYMVEAEVAFTRSIDDIVEVMENLLKFTTERIMTDCEEDIFLYHKHVSEGQQVIVDKILKSQFQRLSYTEAVTILKKFNKKFADQVYWGMDFNKEQEHFLVQHCDNVPVFITDFPTSLKPFYAKVNDGGQTVAAVDLLVPEVGELFGGSVREEQLDVLQRRLQQLQIQHSYEWYLDLRRFGSVPHGGFGMGFERLLQCVLGIRNIRDTIPFPRSIHNCTM